jgi:hypothetical protein
LTKLDAFLSAINNGNFSKEKADELTGSRARTHQTLHTLRRRGHLITLEGNNYVIKAPHQKQVKEVAPYVKEAIPEVLNNLGIAPIHKSLLKKIATLPLQDKRDALDMLKKSIFYGMSAEALIKANEIVHIIEEQS